MAFVNSCPDLPFTNSMLAGVVGSLLSSKTCLAVAVFAAASSLISLETAVLASASDISVVWASCVAVGLLTPISFQNCLASASLVSSELAWFMAFVNSCPDLPFINSMLALVGLIPFWFNKAAAADSASFTVFAAFIVFCLVACSSAMVLAELASPATFASRSLYLIPLIADELMVVGGFRPLSI